MRSTEAAVAECPPADRVELEAAIRSHRGALVLRVGVLLGSEAKRYMLHHRKAYGDLPAYDFVFVGR